MKTGGLEQLGIVHQSEMVAKRKDDADRIKHCTVTDVDEIRQVRTSEEYT